MKEREEKAAEERRKMNEMLMIRKEADAVFRKNEEEKALKRFSENKGLQHFHIDQLVSFLCFLPCLNEAKLSGLRSRP